MELLNHNFQELLRERGFVLKSLPQANSMQYQGRLALAEGVLINFAIQVPFSEGREVVQIVFDHLAQYSSELERAAWLEYLNRLNTESGIHYYFCLRDNGTVFARYMLPVDPDRTGVILELLQIGSHLVRQLRLDQVDIKEVG